MVDLGISLPTILTLLFFIVFISGGIFLWVLSYHFKKFGLPGDKRGRWFVSTYIILYLALSIFGLLIIYTFILN
jgi:TRAP-type C4-dicarboxylate transport system permease small subunit